MNLTLYGKLTTGIDRFPPDAESALRLMEFVKDYARAGSGRRVILTIHQPSSSIWQLMDNVILLAKGKLMYEGSRENMEKFFESCGHATPMGWNPADHYVTMVNDEFRDHGKSVDEWADSNKKFVQPKSEPKDHSRSMVAAAQKEMVETKRSNSFSAVGPLLYRYCLNLWLNPGILGTRVAMYSMLGK
jgi:ABC-type multidrug transport system ATPase subunit